MGPWVVELMGGVWSFTDNHDFLGGGTREQDRIGSAQVHVTYRFVWLHRGMWLAGDANFYKGGQTTINGRRTWTSSATRASASPFRRRSTAASRSAPP